MENFTIEDQDGDILEVEVANGTEDGDAVIYFHASIDGVYLNHEALVRLAEGLNKLDGFTAHYEKPKKALPTEPGLYVAADRASQVSYGITLYRLSRATGWRYAHREGDYSVVTDEVQEIHNTVGLVRLVPEGE